VLIVLFVSLSFSVKWSLIPASRDVSQAKQLKIIETHNSRYINTRSGFVIAKN
jgi:hypothetical protein